MPNGKDYGHPGDSTALVPEALTVYRHFKMSTDMPIGLEAMANPHPYDKPGIQEAVCGRAGGLMSGCSNPNCPLCRFNPFRQAAPAHSSPELECSCGFYAHYDPQTDFYDGVTWTTPRQLEADFESYLFNGGGGLSWFYRTDSLHDPIVRSVVEMSGRVIMGRLGVRAQKMRIKAVAVDWTKYMGSTTDRAAEYRLRDTAHFLGAEFYADSNDMYKAYPKPDLSALGVEPAKLKPKNPRVYNGMKVSGAVSFSSSFYNGSMPSSFGMRQPIVDAEPEPELSPMQRTLLAKKSRPANPAAINYRKRGKNGE